MRLEDAGRRRVSVRRLGGLSPRAADEQALLSAISERLSRWTPERPWVAPPVTHLATIAASVAAVDAGALRAAGRPLSQVLSEAGYEVHLGWVGLRGTAWDSLTEEEVAALEADAAELLAEERTAEAAAVQEQLAGRPPAAPARPRRARAPPARAHARARRAVGRRPRRADVRLRGGGPRGLVRGRGHREPLRRRGQRPPLGRGRPGAVRRRSPRSPSAWRTSAATSTPRRPSCGCGPGSPSSTPTRTAPSGSPGRSWARRARTSWRRWWRRCSGPSPPTTCRPSCRPSGRRATRAARRASPSPPSCRPTPCRPPRPAARAGRRCAGWSRRARPPRGPPPPPTPPTSSRSSSRWPRSAAGSRRWSRSSTTTSWTAASRTPSSSPTWRRRGCAARSSRRWRRWGCRARRPVSTRPSRRCARPWRRSARIGWTLPSLRHQPVLDRIERWVLRPRPAAPG